MYHMKYDALTHTCFPIIIVVLIFYQVIVKMLPDTVKNDILARLATHDKPGRIALSTRYPFLAGTTCFARRAIRWTFTMLNPRLTRTVYSSYFPNVVSRHQSVLMRRLGNSGPRLQQQKITNLKLAVQKLDKLVIKPGMVFSFWHVVGRPDYRKGYVDGMLLSNGQVIEGIGGGLCQLSNLLYWLLLHTPLKITEQHRHAFDVFPDSGRVLPFGSGATIMYNTIDLRVRNNTRTTVQLKLWITEKHLKGQILATDQILQKYHIFEKNHCFVFHKGVYYRYNEIWREESIQGNIQHVERIATNFSPVLYKVDTDYLEKNNFHLWQVDS
ncbi:MAG: VanW family protein [Anaerolineae bacterium]|nr:VanW family protein [Anaerolineae bacterium]